MSERIKLGTALPLTDVGGAPETVAAFAQAAEALGYDHLTGTDHVLGVNVANRPDWDMNRNTGPPPLSWSTVIVRKRRIRDGEQTAQAGRDSHQVAAG